MKRFMSPQKQYDTNSRGVRKNVKVGSCLNQTDLNDAADLVKDLFGPDKSGVFSKQSTGGKWQKRHFCAREGFLFYYHDEFEARSNTAKGCIHLGQVARINRDSHHVNLHLTNHATFSMKFDHDNFASDWERDLTNRRGVLNALTGLNPVQVTVPEGKGDIGMTLSKHHAFNVLVVMKLHHEKNESTKAPMRAESCGVREDDLLISVNGRRCRTEQDASQQLSANENHRKTFVLWRGALASQLATHLRMTNPNVVGGVVSPSGRRLGEQVEHDGESENDKIRKGQLIDEITKLAFDGNLGFHQHTQLQIRSSRGNVYEDDVRPKTKPITDTYELGKVLDGGAFGLVRVATMKRRPGPQFAVKVVTVRSMQIRHVQALRSEIKIMRRLKHPNVCQLTAVYKEDEDYGTKTQSIRRGSRSRSGSIARDHCGLIYMVLEYMNAGTLLDWAVRCCSHAIHGGSGRSSEPTFCEAEVRTLMRQACGALQHCHQKGMIHRDVKPENMLLTRNAANGSLTLKLTDFGLSSETPTSTLVCGTPGYMAPEIHAGREYNRSVDCFALGQTIVLLMTGRMLARYDGKSLSGLDTGHVSPALCDLLLGMISTEPSARPPMDRVARSAWMSDPSLPPAARSLPPSSVRAYLLQRAATTTAAKAQEAKMRVGMHGGQRQDPQRGAFKARNGNNNHAAYARGPTNAAKNGGGANANYWTNMVGMGGRDPMAEVAAAKAKMADAMAKAAQQAKFHWNQHVPKQAWQEDQNHENMVDRQLREARQEKERRQAQWAHQQRSGRML